MRTHLPIYGDHICFDGLFRTGKFQVEHIWPRSRSLDDSLRNKTLCRKDVNARKGNQTPFECFGSDKDEWAAMVKRVDGMKRTQGKHRHVPRQDQKFQGRVDA